MTLTRDGVCYNFYKTPYEVEIAYYGNKKINYKFSSQINVDRFKNKLKENRKKINDSLTNRFKMKITNDVLCDLKLYNKVETRGFLIFSNGVFIECQESIQLDGVEVTSKNSAE
jgi:hypothetical protein